MTTLSTSEAGTLVPPQAARAAVAAIFFANGVLLANWIARIPDVKQGLALSDGALGLALLCLAVGALLAQPMMGIFIGRFGSRGATTAAALAFCAALVLPGLATSLPLLMLALVVLGAFNGGLDVAMNAQAALVERQYGRPIMTSFHALWSFGGLGGAALGGLAAQGLGLGAHLLLAALVGLPVMAFASRWLVPDGGDTAGAGPSFALPPRALLPLGVVAFCALVSEGAVADWSAVYLREGLGSGPGLAAGAYATFALCMAVGRLTGDWLALRLGSGPLVRWSGLLVVAGAGLALLIPSPLLAIMGFGLMGAGLACIFPLVLSAASRTPGVVPSMGIAAMATVGYSGFLAGPPLIGAVATALSLRAALGLLALCGICIVALAGVVGQMPQERRTDG